MKFEEAIKLLRAGKKVRRPMWDDFSFWFLGVDEVILYADGDYAKIHLNQITADDFEEYIEKEVMLDDE